MSQDAAGARKSLSLEHFPNDIVAHILSFDGMTRPIIRLYSTGSHVLQQKVVATASAMHFESKLELEFAKLPSILAELSGLRSLTVDRNDYNLLDVDHTSRILASVAPTLEKLVLRIGNTSRLFGPRHTSAADIPSNSSESAQSNSKNPDDHLLSRFQRLQWLDLGTETIFDDLAPRLPQTLTHLEALFIFPRSTGTIAFPPSLLHLIVHSSSELSEVFFDGLPSGLECLDLSQSVMGSTGLSEQHVQLLPRSLKKLVMSPRNLWTPSPAVLELLPPHLDSIINLGVYPPPEMLGQLKRFAIAEEVELSLKPSQLRQCSRNMEWLKLKLEDHHELSEADFPPSLTHLELELVKKLTISVPGFLPLPGLRNLKLSVTKISVDNINHLPSNLTDLDLFIAEKLVGKDPILLPPSLESLQLKIRQSDDPPSFSTMPRSLTSLKLADMTIDISTLFALPPLLRSFEVGMISNLETFDPADLETIERITYLRRMAQEAGFVFDETLPTRAPREYGVFDLLPRTLTKLVIDSSSGAELPIGHWQSLPKKLTLLVLLCSTDDLDYLPFETVDQLLTLENVIWKNEHVKRLNPRLRRLENYDSKCEITPEYIPWTPRETYLSNKHDEIFDELQDKRRAALENLDREAFHALNPRSRL